jgi:hypothetical protein
MEAAMGAQGVASAPKEVFGSGFARTRDWWSRGYSMAPDGRFLVIRDVPEPAVSAQIHVVTNWFEELKRLAPASF